jgi:putative ABC transport system permease protein
MNLLHDVRFAWRVLARNPSYAAAALAVVALGIGMTTAVFSVVRAVLLQPLPYRDVDRLITFRADAPTVAHAPALTAEEYLALGERTDLFEGIGTVNESRISITGVDDMENVPAASISDNLLALFGTAPAIGRQVNRRDDIGNPYMRAVNVSYELWQRRWHGDPSLVGRHIEVNNIDVVVAGIMPRGFRIYMGPGTNISDRIDIWAPGAPDLGTARSVPAVARLTPGVTVAAAQRAIDAFMPPFMAAHASSYRLGPVKLTLTRLDQDVVRDVKPALVALSGAVGFVLLIACANLTNLLLARACARTRELAVRRSIGASRARLVAQLTTESVVIWVIGAALGLLVAQWAIDGLLQVAPAALPRREQIGIDFGVAAFAISLSLVSSLLFGLVPALQATSEDLTGTLKQDPSSSRGAAATRGLLVAAQLALSLMLLVGAGLMMRAFVSLRQVPVGFDPSHVMTMSAELHRGAGMSAPQQRLAFFNSVADAVRAVPGVTQAGLGLPIPLSKMRFTQRYARDENAPEQVATGLVALAGFLETLRVGVREGRAFAASDNAPGRSVVLIDDRLALSLWPGQPAVGQRLMLGTTSAPREWAEVVGVVEHLQVHDVRGSDQRPQIWSTYGARPSYSLGVAARTAGDPRALAGSIKNAIERLGPKRPVIDVQPLDDYVAAASADTRFALFVLAAFALTAVVLTGIGVYGVVAYTTARRTREIAVRRALGADGRRIVELVIRDGLGWTAAGIGAGVLGALALSRYLSSLLFHVGEHDAITYLSVAMLLIVIAAVATAIPVVRAVHVDPMLALRSE